MPSRVSQQWDTRSENSSNSGYSDASDHSRHSHSTAATAYSRRPSVHQDQHEDLSLAGKRWEDTSFNNYVDPRSSECTYASTVPSITDFDDEVPPFDLPEHEYEHSGTAIPSTPEDFSEYFPSTRRLYIRHDDSTLDGNMNLRVDTEIPASEGRKLDLTLFHLRMHDLKNREFSLRRYCRDSGREVCHSSRKYTKPATERRPLLQRSLSNALSSIRPKTSDASTSLTPGLKRHDSGYESMSDDEGSESAVRSIKNRSSIPLPTNTTQLEFSNYAHIDVKRRGTKSSKRYEFEYWGKTYTWKRLSRRDGNSREISYHLMTFETKHAVAHIVPTVLTPTENQMEDAKGGWVRPCLLWIDDENISHLNDLAE